MELTIPMKKKHLLLLNRLMREQLKKEIIPVPSKLSEDDVNAYFNRLFVKKDEHYVPIKSKIQLKIDESLFMDLLKSKKKTKVSKPSMTEEPKVTKIEEPKVTKTEEPKVTKPSKLSKMDNEDEEDIEFIQDPEKLSKSLLDASMMFVNKALKKFNDNYVIKFVNLRKENKLDNKAYYELTEGYLNLSPLAKYYALKKYKTLEGLVKPHIKTVIQMIDEKKKESEKNIKEMKKIRDIRKKEEEKTMQKNLKEEFKMEKEKLKQEAESLKKEQDEEYNNDTYEFKDILLLKQAIEEYYLKKFGKKFIINDEIPNYDNSIKKLVEYIKKTFNKNDLDNIKYLYNKPLDNEIADLQTNLFSGKAKVELNKKIAKLKSLMVKVPKEKVKKEEPKKKELTEEEKKREEMRHEQTRQWYEYLATHKKKKSGILLS